MEIGAGSNIREVVAELEGEVDGRNPESGRLLVRKADGLRRRVLHKLSL